MSGFSRTTTKNTKNTKNTKRYVSHLWWPVKRLTWRQELFVPFVPFVPFVIFVAFVVYDVIQTTQMRET